jgi:hypothetical protein
MEDRFELTVLASTFVVSRLDPTVPVPAWALQGTGFVAICRTEEELSIISADEWTPEVAGPRWRGLKVHGPFPFEAIGVIAALSRVLAAAKVSLLAVSTHDTDYLFVRTPDLARAVRALRHDGHVVHTPGATDPGGS